ncbi:SCF ubiquitin ligase complex subunit CDC4 NDAI_0G03310 [Naumovozyma dairenensis CBS 421]|uniref:F-box domain-containing protein n=1 Tax=Naumovozyma dairenensis (strain ATCC 10597 / BCRC 20456 / CBS 421 / NBRC 0211 / NRRL Y-12639) TaxID=1071378 RepID=G0WE97_NAUDC|nr:hypothetical protein NDAI_0G03310 [Naumovozyma dairenensis CBS 421]CCD26108.2 hypothetical protein NDAI_0G03310 [Naumovozyma dairenensis CBS 421]
MNRNTPEYPLRDIPVPYLYRLRRRPRKTDILSTNNHPILQDHSISSNSSNLAESQNSNGTTKTTNHFQNNNNNNNDSTTNSSEIMGLSFKRSRDSDIRTILPSNSQEQQSNNIINYRTNQNITKKIKNNNNNNNDDDDDDEDDIDDMMSNKRVKLQDLTPSQMMIPIIPTSLNVDTDTVINNNTLPNVSLDTSRTHLTHILVNTANRVAVATTPTTRTNTDGGASLTTVTIMTGTTASNTTTSTTNTVNGYTSLSEDALPLSPTATSGMNTPRTQHHESTESDDCDMIVDTNGNRNNNNNTTTNNNNALDLNMLVTNTNNNDEYLLTENLYNNLKNQLTPIQYKNLIFKIISNLNRTELSDMNSLLNNNLKRDIISSLPIELSIKILKNLPYQDIFKCLQVCPHWNKIINNTPMLWKNLLLNESFLNNHDNNNTNENNSSQIYKKLFYSNLKVLKNWYNPNFKPQRTTLLGHSTSVVTCLQFEDDYVITGADDRQLRIYDSKKKIFLKELSGHEGGVWALKYDEDGIIVSGSTDRTVRVWDIKRGCCTHVFKGHTSTVRCLEIVTYKNIKYIVTGSRDNTLHVWKLVREDNRSIDELPLIFNTPEENPYFVGVLRGHMASVRTISGHGNIIISGSYDNNLMVWDIAQMKCIYLLIGHTDRIYSTIYDHQRKRCISASMDSTIKIWDLENIWNNGVCSVVTISATPCTRINGPMMTLQGHTALVGLLRLSDKYLVSAAADGSLRGWDSNDYSRKFSYHHNNLSAITTFFMNDNILVSGSEGQFNIYNLRTGSLVHSDLLKDSDQIWSVNFKGSLLVAAVEKDGESYIEMLDFNIPERSASPLQRQQLFQEQEDGEINHHSSNNQSNTNIDSMSIIMDSNSNSNSNI